MTRINVGIPPAELVNQHLLAEHREIKRIPNCVAKGKYNMDGMPERFKLGTGHVKFFYNKGKYLSNRYDKLITEMKRRRMNPDPSRKFKREQWPDEMYNDWQPNDHDKKIVELRIKQRISEKPDWYRFSGMDK